MKKLFFVFSIIGVLALTSCGAQEDCRTRPSSNKYEQSQSQTQLAYIAPSQQEVKK